MNPLSDEELVELLDNLESDRIERKRAWAGDAPEKARQAVCAFANDLPNHDQPGVVFIGANDDGSVAHIEVTDKLLQTLSDMKTDGKTVPPPTLTVERRVLKVLRWPLSRSGRLTRHRCALRGESGFGRSASRTRKRAGRTHPE